MFRLQGLVVATVLMVAVQVSAQSSTSKESTFVPAPSAVQVRAVSEPGLAIDIGSTSLQSDFGSGVSRLSFTATNNTGARAENLRFAAYFLQDNAIIGGQQWCARKPLDSGERGSYSLPVPHAFSRPTTVLIAVRQASADGRIFDLPGSSIREAVETLGTAPFSLTPQITAALLGQTSAATPNIICDPNFCTFCITEARSTCGSTGVKSVSCSISTCSCSFTCK